jgi:hypothetical protein
MNATLPCPWITGMIRHYAAEGLAIWSSITGIMPM